MPEPGETSQHRRLLAATNNTDKLREIRQILAGTGWGVVGLDAFPPYPEPPEDGDTLVENALQKAREGYNRTGLLSLADDTGLEIDALNGYVVRESEKLGLVATYNDALTKLVKGLQHIPIDKTQVGN